MGNARTIKSLTNSGTISGGMGGSAAGGAGGVGVSNGGTITSLTNSGAITGGNGGNSSKLTDVGGEVCLTPGRSRVLSNSGTIGGGTAGAALVRTGGAGVLNADGATVGSLINEATGTISGGNGGAGAFSGGAGVSNAGTIRSLTNKGTIEGGPGTVPGAAGDAIYSAGPHASIGSIANSGRIIGNVEIDRQANVTIQGGSGATFGSFSGGAITIGNGSLDLRRQHRSCGRHRRQRRRGRGDR